MAGLTVQVTSVVRHVYASRLQPQVQCSCFSIAWIAASLSAAVTGGSGRPARAGSHRRPDGPVPGRESGPWADGRTGGRAVSRAPPSTVVKNWRRSQTARPPDRPTALTAPPPAPPHIRPGPAALPATPPATSRSVPPAPRPFRRTTPTRPRD